MWCGDSLRHGSHGSAMPKNTTRSHTCHAFRARTARRSLTAAGAAVGLSLGATGVASAATTTMYPIADAYVNSNSAAGNYGTTTSLRSNDPLRIAFLKFKRPAGTVTGLRLRVYRTAGSGTTPLVLRTVDSENSTETGVTFLDPARSDDLQRRVAGRRRRRVGRDHGAGVGARMPPAPPRWPSNAPVPPASRWRRAKRPTRRG